MANEVSRGGARFILNSLPAIRYSLFPHPSPTHRCAMNGAPAYELRFMQRGGKPLSADEVGVERRPEGSCRYPTPWTLLPVMRKLLPVLRTMASSKAATNGSSSASPHSTTVELRKNNGPKDQIPNTGWKPVPLASRPVQHGTYIRGRRHPWPRAGNQAARRLSQGRIRRNLNVPGPAQPV